MLEPIVIKGTEGSYHYEAANKLYGPRANIEYMETFPDVLDALRDGKIPRALVAISNSKVGPIEPREAVLSGDFFITGETFVHVEHQLLGIPGATPEGIREVHSAVPALGQCALLFRDGRLPKGVKREEEEDTADSARLVAFLNNPGIAAIASRFAAKLHGLDILLPNVNDEADNTTRFVRLERRNGQKPKVGDNMSSLLVTITQDTGSLADVLNVLKVQKINITEEEHPPLPKRRRTVRFLFDAEAALNDYRMKLALHQIRALAVEVLPVGSYAKADLPVSEEAAEKRDDTKIVRNEIVA